MRRLAAVFALALALGVHARAQYVSEDYDFALYLIDNDLKADAKALLGTRSYMPSDTLTFLKAWTHYQLKELEEASSLFRAVPVESPFHEKSLFYSAAVSAHLGDFTSPVAELEAYGGPFGELRSLQLAGLALLRGDKDAYLQASQAFRFEDFALQEAEHQLEDIFNYRYEQKPKSPWLAAAASALVPGLGKIYAGQTGEGVSAFLVTGAFGAITAEHWIKDGLSDWKTIVPGLLFATLYLGNIYGSYMSVSIYNTKIRDAQDTAVLYNIHIPLRAVFK